MKSIIPDNKITNKNSFFVFFPKKMKMLPLDFNLNININDLQGIDKQKEIILKNTDNFIYNKPSENILLWGAKGMGKSSLIKSIIDHFNQDEKKLKLVEIFNHDLEYIPELIYELSQKKFKFIIFIDDISFKNNDKDFRLFKSLIEGSILSNVKNIRYYITSNLRHLSHTEGNDKLNEIESREISENLISLSDRFGCWIGFHNSDQHNYLKTVKYYLNKKNIEYTKLLEKKALEWSTEKGSFSGRTAYQFINKIT